MKHYGVTSQGKLAKLIDEPQAAISRWVRGSGMTVDKAAKLLGLLPGANLERALPNYDPAADVESELRKKALKSRGLPISGTVQGDTITFSPTPLDACPRFDIGAFARLLPPNDETLQILADEDMFSSPNFLFDVVTRNIGALVDRRDYVILLKEEGVHYRAGCIAVESEQLGNFVFTGPLATKSQDWVNERERKHGHILRKIRSGKIKANLHRVEMDGILFGYEVEVVARMIMFGQIASNEINFLLD